jgi:hypothetical protein
MLQVAIFCLAILAMPLYALESVHLGDSALLVRQTMGSPTRSVDTGDGEILFYGPHLIYISGGTVDFMSEGELIPVSHNAVNVREEPGKPGIDSRIETRSDFLKEHPEFTEAVKRAEWVLIARLRRAIMKQAYHAVINREFFELPLGMIAVSHLGARDAHGFRLMDGHGFIERQPISYTMGLRVQESPPLSLAHRSR